MKTISLRNAEAALDAAGAEVSQGIQIVDAAALATRHHPIVEPTLPLLVTHTAEKGFLSTIRSTLLNAYPLDHPICLISEAGDQLPEVQRTTLDKLAVQPLQVAATHLYVPPLPYGSSMADLQEIVAHLRAPEGCPWDREQTLASLRQDLLGEAVEVLEAIDVERDGSDNGEHIAEELGDLLLLAAMMVQIATESGRFKMPDVTNHVVHKLIRRHPHVFGDEDLDGMDQLFANWDAIKAQEKAAKGLYPAGPLDGVPAHLPALEKARKLQAKAHKGGLLDRSAVARRDPAVVALLDGTDAEQLGRLLWQVVALAHEHGLNAEDALRAYAVRYRRDAPGIQFDLDERTG